MPKISAITQRSWVALPSACSGLRQEEAGDLDLRRRFYGGYDANTKSGCWTQVAGAGRELHYTFNSDGSLTPIADQDPQAQGFEVDAPAYQWCLRVARISPHWVIT
jgi:hypothetical protein